MSELLEKHGLQKPVSFVKDTKDNAEEARKLMIRLTRHTGRKLVFKGELEIKGDMTVRGTVLNFRECT